MSLPSFYSLFHEGHWIIYTTVLSFVALTLTYLFRFTYKRMERRLLQGRYFIAHTIFTATYLPLLLYVWLQLFISVINFLAIKKLNTTVLDIMTKVHGTVGLLILSWGFTRFIRMFESQLLSGNLTKKQPDEITVHAIGRLFRVASLLVVVLTVLSMAGVDLSGLIAIGGGSAVIIGIAVRPILSNYFGGLLIYSGRLFKVGDWIKSPDREIEGTVENIGWHTTCIRNFEKRPLYVPNSVFPEVTLINVSRMTNRRIKEDVAIRYEDIRYVKIITDEIRTMLRTHPDIDSNQSTLVNFLKFERDALIINIYAFTKTKDWKIYRDVQQDIFIKVVEIIESKGAKLAWPVQKVYFKADENQEKVFDV